jgi:hypothetical protein
MPLLLKSVDPQRGLRWVGDAVRLFVRRPLGFTLMLLAFGIVMVLVARLLPVLGPLLLLMSVPLLSLGYMVASQSALLDGPVHPGAYIEPLRGDKGRRRSLLLLCLLYGLAALAIILLCTWVSNNAPARWYELMGKGVAAAPEIEALVNEPGVTTAIALFVVLGTALTVPYWHAPALVHWGGQGVAQALFSSTLAVWRAKGAFLAYGIAWIGLFFTFGLIASVLFALAGPQVASFVVTLGALVLNALFYVSLLFTFNDSFGGAAGAAGTPGPVDSGKMPF